MLAELDAARPNKSKKSKQAEKSKKAARAVPPQAEPVPRLVSVEQELHEARRLRLAAEEDMCCVICLEHRRCVVLLPCAHLCLCDQCTFAECPLCRAPVLERLRVLL